ncbi:MAG: ATP-binding protein [Planctomycetota bacterium]|nr:ATP-binding protein [Planctomycetota bacterium]
MPPNPFRPGAGHSPPYLSGRSDEAQHFRLLLGQAPVMTNLVLTGLRGVGKTVLLEALKPLANEERWLWAGTDMSESSTVSEEHIAIRIMADLAPLVSNIVVAKNEIKKIGFARPVEQAPVHLDYTFLNRVYAHTPGLAADKLKGVLELVWSCLRNRDCRGIVLAYDEAQNLNDQAKANQYPLSLLLDVFQSIQKKENPILLVLSGLPTLFPKLVDARTFAERMFEMMTLERLGKQESEDAILKAIKKSSPVRFSKRAVSAIIRNSGGYPYFIQYLSRAMYDSYSVSGGRLNPDITVEQAIHQLDTDFFWGRWNRATDRQRDLLEVIAELPNCDEEFALKDIVDRSKELLEKPFSASQINQMLVKLADSGLVYKNRRARYSFALPLLGGFIKRQKEQGIV